MRRAAPISEGEAVSRLMKFLFDYEQVRRPLDSLSGGEWTRLQLLLLMLGGANCLLLDEPTNHLDIESVEMLEAALESFEGTALFVSHDRYFLDRMADRIVEVEGGAVRSFEGGWSTWRARRDAGAWLLDGVAEGDGLVVDRGRLLDRQDRVTVKRSHGVHGAVVLASVAALSASMIATPPPPPA